MMACERTGFLTAFAGVCRGREIFPRLLRQSLWRALAHLLLTALLCAAAGAALRYLDRRSAWQRQAARFEETFGGLIAGPDWLIPGRDPDRPRTLTFPERLKLIYAPSPAAVPPFPAEDADEGPVLVWLPRRGVLMQSVGDGKVMVSTFDPRGTIATADYHTIPAAECGDFFARMPADPRPLPDPADPDAVRLDAAPLILWTPIVGFFGWLLLEEFAALVLFLLLFLGIFAVTAGTRGRTMSYRELFLAGLYASLPVLPVACCFPVFDLPLMTFSTAYLLGAMGYFLFIVNYIERSRRNGAEVPPTEG